MIEDLMGRPRKTPYDVKPGFYRLDDAIIEVCTSRAGNLYTKSVEVIDGSVRKDYAPGLLHKIAAEDRLTGEEAAQWGRLTGYCMVCGRTLTDPNSLDRGIGPVCARRFA